MTAKGLSKLKTEVAKNFRAQPCVARGIDLPIDTMSSFDLLDAKEEEELYKTRLLNVEEKPFKRITKRLATLHTLASARIRQQLTPPPEGRDAAEVVASKDVAELAQLREDISLDFAAFDAAIVRLQFLFTANERERDRYATAHVNILDTCQKVRDNTATLRGLLDQARATLEQRKKFDELADKITSNRLLRPRADQQANLQKLEEECKQLEEESETYAETWLERRAQFARIMDESMRLRRLIRDEKEEVERREGMADEGGEAGAAEGADDSQTPRAGIASGHATPHPDSGMIPKAAAGGLEVGDAGTPLPASTVGGRTPARDSPGPETEGLKVRPDALSSFSRNASRAPSHRGSEEPEEGEDVQMEDSLRPGDMSMESTYADTTPRIAVDSQETAEEQMDTT